MGVAASSGYLQGTAYNLGCCASKDRQEVTSAAMFANASPASAKNNVVGTRADMHQTQETQEPCLVVGLPEEALTGVRTDARHAGNQKAAIDVQAAYRGWFARKELAAQVQTEQMQESVAPPELGLDDTWAVNLANEAKQNETGAEFLAGRRKRSLVPSEATSSHLVVTARRLVPTRFVSTELGKRFRLARRAASRASASFRWTRAASDQGYDV